MYQKIFLLLFIFSLIFLTGCWDRIEPEKQAIVIGGGFDYNQERELYQIIFQIISPLTIQTPGGGGGGTDKPNFWTVSAWGHTPYDAIVNINKKVSRRISFSHAQLYIFSEAMAREKGVLPVLNAIARSRESRRIVTLAVSKDNVQEILSKRLPIESSNVVGLTNQIRLTMEEMGGVAKETARDFFIKLVQPGNEPYTVALELVKEGESGGDEDKEGPDTEPPVRITGKYLFHDDKVVGSFNDRETRGCNWIIGDVRSGTLVVKYPGQEENNMVDIIATEGSAEIIPIINNGKPEIKLKIKVKGRIVNVTGITDIKTDEDIIGSLNRRMAAVIHNDIELALQKAQALESDIFGFGFAFYRGKYDRWQLMKDDWDEIFSTLPVETEIKTEIRRAGLVNKGPDIR